MKRTKNICLALAAVLLSPMVANADIISYSGTGGIAGADTVIDFSGSTLGMNDSVTTEFSGVTFSGASGSPRFNPCGTWGSKYMLDNDFIAGFGPGCTSSPDGVAIDDDFTAVFDQVLQSASFYFLSYHSGDPGTAVTISAYLGTDLVASFDIFANTDDGSPAATPLPYRASGWIIISGAHFDSIQVSEGTYTNYLAMDDLAFSVPEPGTLGLLGLGLAGMGMSRRKKKV